MLRLVTSNKPALMPPFGPIPAPRERAGFGHGKHHRSRHKDAAWQRELEKHQQHPAEMVENRRKELERRESAETALAAEHNRAI